MTDQHTVEIAPGVSMPFVGLGTWALRDTYRAVRSALDAGYRHIDTAAQYGNETAVGAALRDSGLAREDVFVTTKILSRHIGVEQQVVTASLRNLNSDYVDLWLIHDPPPPGLSERLWTFMIGLQERGQARAIGVSEYGTSEVDAIIAATGVRPAVNHIRWAPALFDARRLAELRERRIQVEGFSGFRLTDLRDDTLLRIADRHGVTTAQLVVRWHLEHGIVTIPRSDTPQRITANIDVWGFALTPAERDAIDALSMVHRRAASTGSLVGAHGTVIAPTGVPTGAGEIDLTGEPAVLAWSKHPIAVGTPVRVVGQRGPRAVDITAITGSSEQEDGPA